MRRNAAARLLAALSNPETGQNREAIEGLRNEIAGIDGRNSAIAARLSSEFSEYSALTNPKPLGIEDTQKLLKAKEALVFILTNERESYVFGLSSSDFTWKRIPHGAQALSDAIASLRCGLDVSSWESGRCGELTGQHYTDADRDAGKPLPFDLARAYALYQELFGQVEDLIRGKQLLIVPSGPLTQLPFQVLVTHPPKAALPSSLAGYRDASWLVRKHAITMLPAPSSLKALRGETRPSAAKKPMIGFGNPLLNGPDSSYASLARIARARQACSAPFREVAALSPRGGVKQVETRGELADISQLREQVPLPETAVELCAVARDVGADLGDIRLGARATEREIKHLSESGQLAQYRIVHFATHGALAGQVRGNAEPGLLLTPPDVPNEEDDGYLTASEIAVLKLDADWVILSACNTAAGSAQGAEALSGLARAFIYAQARALLVSHWEVNSDATVKLIMGAMSRLAADKTMGRAEALQQSMLALIDNGKPAEAHPAYWAPFIVVGEGGR